MANIFHLALLLNATGCKNEAFKLSLISPEFAFDEELFKALHTRESKSWYFSILFTSFIQLPLKRYLFWEKCGYKTDDRELNNAILKRNYDLAHYLIVEKHFDINKKYGINNETLLVYISINGKFETLKFLVEHGADMNQSDTIGNTPLIYAAISGRQNMVRYLISQGADVHARNNFFQNAYLACLNGKVKKNILSVLFENGVDVNSFDDDKTTGLMWVCNSSSCRLDIVQFLLQKGADVNMINSDYNSALLYCTMNVTCDFTVVDLLLKHGANVHYVNNRGESALFWACYNKNISKAFLLLQNGADVNSANIHYGSMLYVVLVDSEESNLDFIEFLLANGADPNLKIPSRNRTVLHVAAQQGKTDAIELLLEHGADIHAVDIEGNTPLHYAVSRLHLIVEVKLLLKRGADMNMKNRAGKTPRDVAEECGNDGALAYMKKRAKKVDG